MEVLRLQAAEETVSASLPYVQYAMAPCYRPDIRPWSEKPSELAERSGAVCESLARQSNVATAKCALGPTWQQSAQNSEKEVKAEERQRQQDPSRRTTNSARSHDAESTDDGDANGLPRSNATCSAPHELGHAAYADDAGAISTQWQPASIASSSSWWTVVCSTTRTDAAYATSTTNELCHGSRIHNASDAKGAHHAGADRASLPRAHVDAEARCGCSSASHPESSEGVCDQGWSQRWCTSHKEIYMQLQPI